MPLRRQQTIERRSTLEVENGDIDAVLEAHINELCEEEAEISQSEQEMIENGCNELLENAISTFESIIAQATAHVDENEGVDVSRLLNELKLKKAATLLQFSEYLDARLTRLRRSFQAYRYSTLKKLSDSRKSIVEYKRVHEIASAKFEEDRIRLLMDDTMKKYDSKINELSTKYRLLKSTYEIASNKVNEMEIEKMEMTDTILKLESQTQRAEDSANKAARRINELERSKADLSQEVEDLKAQKLLRQQMGHRRSSKSGGKMGMSKASLRRSSSTPLGSVESDSSNSTQCSQCMVLQEMLQAAQKQISELARVNRGANASFGFDGDTRNTLGSIVGPTNIGVSRVSSPFRNAAGVSTENPVAKSLCKPDNPADKINGSVRHDASGEASLTLNALIENCHEEDQDDADEANARRDSPQPLESSGSSADNNVQWKGGKVSSRIQSAVMQDMHYQEHVMAEGPPEMSDCAADSGLAAVIAPRRSVFPDAKPKPVEHITAPIYLAAQNLDNPEMTQRPRLILESEPQAGHDEPVQPPSPRESSPKNDVDVIVAAPPVAAIVEKLVEQSIGREVGPVDASLEEDLKEVPVPMPVEVFRAPPSVLTTKNEEVIASATPAPLSPARSIEEYQTATQALQMKMSVKYNDDDSQSVTSLNAVSHKDIANALKVPAPRAPVNPDPKIPNDVSESVFNMLTEAVNAQRQLEAENRALQDENLALSRKLEDIVAFVHTQEHISALKVKERDVLLKELTEQVHEVRAELRRDRKLFAEIERSRQSLSLPSLRSGRMALSSMSTLTDTTRRKPVDIYKLDITMDNMEADPKCRPLTATSSRELHAFHLHSSQDERPSTSPVMQTEELLPLTANISDSLKGFCGSGLHSKPSQYTSMGLGSYQHVVDCIWDEDSKSSMGICGAESWDGKVLKETAAERKEKGKKKVEDLRRKMALLIAHQEIVLKRFQGVKDSNKHWM